MPLTFADLTTPETDAQATDRILDLLEVGGFPAYAWQEGTVPRELVRAEARGQADVAAVIASTANAGFLATARGPWLTLRARQSYGVTRKASSFAQGRVVLADHGGGPFNDVQVGDLIVADLLGRRFKNVEEFSLAEDGTVSVLVEGESPGAAWNVATGGITTMVTTLPTVTVSNPGTGGQWLTQQGSDEEDDSSLILRCMARWPQFGGGATALAYQGWALDASLEVRRVRVMPPPGDGSVPIVLAGASGGVSAQAVADALAYLQLRKPINDWPQVTSVNEVLVPIVATLTVKPAFAAGALTAALKAIEALRRETDIGDTLYRAAIIEALMNPRGAKNVVLVTPDVDVLAGPSDILIPQPTITIVSAP